MTAVEQVIAVIDVADIDIIGVIPVICPVFRPWINQTEPITSVLEAGKSANNKEGAAVNPEPMVGPKVTAETVVRNPVADIAAALPPSAVVRLPAL